jgi:hypothetical protein
LAGLPKELFRVGPARTTHGGWTIPHRAPHRTRRLLAPLFAALMIIALTAPTASAQTSLASAARNDKVKPHVTLKAPRSSVSGVVGARHCSARATDNVRVARVVITVDRKQVTTRRGRRATCRWNTRKVRNGRHVVTATAYDLAGNRRSTSRAVRVKNHPPHSSGGSTGSTSPPPSTAPSGSTGTEGSVPAPFTPVAITGRTYYVSPTGSDSNSGTSPTAAWRTVNKANNAAMSPGDGILFQGGATFAENTLMPSRSGTASARIVYGSYGGGQANLPKGVWFRGPSHLVFQNLAIDGTAQGVNATGDDIVLQGMSITNSSVGVNGTGDGWLIEGSTVDRAGDSGMLLLGTNHTVRGNLIQNTGIDPSITYGKHGIYLKVAGARITGNLIQHYQGGSGISARYHSSIIENNTIDDGKHGLSFFQQDGVAGTSYWRNNKITRTTYESVYVSRSADAGPTIEHFVITDNVMQKTSGQWIVMENDPSLNTIERNTLL